MKKSTRDIRIITIASSNVTWAETSALLAIEAANKAVIAPNRMSKTTFLAKNWSILFLGIS
ncbi:MAG: hypothetical protein QXO21_03405 [Candidatus Anstonellales archaeon]